MDANYKRKMFYVGESDDAAIKRIREKYGLSSDSDAVRLAVRLVAGAQLAQLPANKKKSPSAKARS